SRVSTRKKLVKRVRETDNKRIATKAQLQTVIKPKSGAVGTLHAFAVYIPAPASTTSGDHRVYLTVGFDTAYQVERIWDSGARGHNGAIEVKIADIISQVKGVVFDEENPLVITYHNNTDKDHTGVRMHYALFSEEN